MKKSQICLFLLVLLTIIALTGCNENNGAVSENIAPTQSTPTNATDNMEKEILNTAEALLSISPTAISTPAVTTAPVVTVAPAPTNGTAEVISPTGEINNNSPDTVGNDPNNFVYGGFIAADDDNYYMFMQTSYDNIAFCSINKANSNITILNKNLWIEDINLDADYIYYSQSDANLSNKNTGIYRMNKDGSNVTCLLTGKYSGLRLINHELYFSGYDGDYNQYKMQIDGSDLTLNIEGEGGSFMCKNGYYYDAQFNSDDHSKVNIFRYNIDNMEKEIVIPSLSYQPDDYISLIAFFVTDNRLIYLPNNGYDVISTNLDGTDSKTIIKGKVDTMVITPENIIYCMTSTLEAGFSLGKYDLEGNPIETVNSDNLFGLELIGVAGDYLFFNYNLGEGCYDCGRMKFDGTCFELFGDKIDAMLNQ